jgi:hypothetical protein
MYGYRRRDIGLLRLFLPRELHVVFRAINQMERGLRQLIQKHPEEEFRGVYVDSGLSVTRKNILAPGSVGVYSAGSIYNPAQIVRDRTAAGSTEKLDKAVASIQNKTYVELPIEDLQKLVAFTMPDQSQSERVWNPIAVSHSVAQFGLLHKHTTGFVYVDRDRGLKENRRETQGILEGGEARRVPNNRITLFLLRTTGTGAQSPGWWPQVRFPDGRYAFAFAV